MIAFLKTLLEKFWRWAGAVSVRTKVFGIVLLSTLVLSISFIVQVRLTMFNYLENQAVELGFSIADDVASRAVDLILTNDLYSLYQLLHDTQQHFSNVRYIFIVDTENDVLASTFNGGFPLELLDANHVVPGQDINTVVLETEEGLIWDIAVPVFEGRLGEARVGISETALRETLQLLTSQLALTMVAMLVFSLLAASLLTMVLNRPITELSQAARDVGQGNFNVHLVPWADDELGEMAQAFNAMVADLRHLDTLRAERERLKQELLIGTLKAQEDERQRISRELHDSAAQSLTSLKVGLRTLLLSSENTEQSNLITHLYEIADKTLNELHAISVNLRPPLLDDLGLKAALQNLVEEWQRQYHIPIDLLIDLKNQRFPPEIEIVVYRVVQEALTNIARHANASNVSLIVQTDQQTLFAIIEDDGQGFNREAVHAGTHLGLVGMRERVELVHGEFQIETAPGAGTSLFVRIPLEER
jgi:signal transduction histidine kinase